MGQSFFRFSFYHCIEKSCTLKIWWSSPNKIFKTLFFGFLGFCWQIQLYFVLAGIICWSVESCLSGSTKMQLFLTWSNTGWILNNLWSISSGFSFTKLSLTKTLRIFDIYFVCFISPIHTKIQEIGNWYVYLYRNKLFNLFCCCI